MSLTALDLARLADILFVEVKNLHGTSDNTPNGTDKNLSWKEWWEKRTQKRFGECSCSSCTNFADVGAHVKKTDSSDGKWYIVPLCYSCNAKKEPFRVLKIDLVPVNEDN